MGIPNVGKETLVFQIIDGCMCCGCIKKVRKILLQLDATSSIGYDAGEGKLTIQGNNLDSNMMITELGNIKKYVELVTEQNPTIDQTEEKQTLVDEMEDLSVVVDNPIVNQIEKKQLLVNEMEVLTNEASAVVLNRTTSYNQVVGLSALSMASPFYSKLDHEHEFELKQYDKRFTCDGCKEEGYRTRYRCKHCDYELHEGCMHPKPTVSHDLFEGLIFKFSREKPICSSLCKVHTKSCEACGNEIHGYAYHCEDNNLYLHPSCVNFTRKLCIQGETFVLKNKATHKCFLCNESENKANSGWSYVSEGNKEQLHVNCMAKITHEAWKERAIGGSDDVFIAVITKRLNWGIVDNKKKNGWSKGGKLLKIIIVFARTIIGILLGDPTVILASMLVEVLKK